MNHKVANHSGCTLCASGVPVVKKRLVSGRIGHTVWGIDVKPVRGLRRGEMALVMASVSTDKSHHPAVTNEMIQKYWKAAWSNLSEEDFVKIVSMLGHTIDAGWIVKQQYMDDDAGAGICCYRTGCFECQQIFQITYDDRYEEWAFNIWGAHKEIEPHPTDPDVLTLKLSDVDFEYFSKRQRPDMYCSKFRALL